MVLGRAEELITVSSHVEMLTPASSCAKEPARVPGRAAESASVLGRAEGTVPMLGCAEKSEIQMYGAHFALSLRYF